MYVFYHAPGSSSMAVHIALHEVGAAFEGRTIAFAHRDQDPSEFRGLNPEGKVPTLVVDGQVLTEVAGILWYLARRYPEAALLPVADVWAEARIVSWMSFIASTLHPARRQGDEHARAMYRLADQRLGTGPWAVGAYSIADIHLFRLFWRFRGSLGADPAAFPNLTAHFDRMTERPAVRKTFEDEAALGYALPA
ncbi:glutathione S-transferase family protein [Acidisphaera sp. S103]|uniref:glutathione S-transferase family protein n=1 Tax=Acidisphaera sp. S103 TaxID=1747223 RepID=UPI00131C4EDA|nr:glutathione S-transferase family protein [Acidisphaera sp. S103]